MEDHTLLACDLLQHTIGMRIRGYQARELAVRLEREFVALYGIEPNLPYRQMLNLARPEKSEWQKRSQSDGLSKNTHRSTAIPTPSATARSRSSACG